MTTMTNSKKTITIGIAGGSGSGKSTIANKLKENLNKNTLIICTDEYFIKPLPKMISPQNMKEYDDWNAPGSIDFKGLYERIIKEQRNGYELLIIEGIGTLYLESIRELLDIKVFVDLDSDERMYRRIKRNMKVRGLTLEEVGDYYVESAKYSEAAHFLPTKIHADIILNGNSENLKFIEIISKYL